jgi:hypothetical protein
MGGEGIADSASARLSRICASPTLNGLCRVQAEGMQLRVRLIIGIGSRIPIMYWVPVSSLRGH